MRRRIYLLLLAIIPVSITNAQVTGYLGKKFIVHTDLITPVLMKGFDIDAEYALLRSISIVAGAHTTNKDYSGYLEGNDDESYPNPRYHINSKNVSVGLRFYRTAAYAAPKGIYTLMNFQYGIIDVEGYTYHRDNQPYGGVILDEGLLYKYTARNISVGMFEIGGGTQNVFFERWVLDYGTSLCFSYNLTKDPQIYSISRSGVAKYGPNLLRLSALDDAWEGMGISFHLRIGYLLF